MLSIKYQRITYCTVIGSFVKSYRNTSESGCIIKITFPLFSDSYSIRAYFSVDNAEISVCIYTCIII